MDNNGNIAKIITFIYPQSMLQGYKNENDIETRELDFYEATSNKQMPLLLFNSKHSCSQILIS